MKVILAIIVATMAIVVAAEKQGTYRMLPSYKTGSGAYGQRQYETTTYAGPTYTTSSYQVAETDVTYEDESIYKKAYARSSHKPSTAAYLSTTPSYSKASYKPSTSAYETEPNYYKAAEPGRSYSSKPTRTDSFYSFPVYTTTTSAPYPTNERYPDLSYSKKQDSYNYKPMPYEFSWGVKDEKSYNDYSHQQESNGKVVSGSYRVLLPDGRTQIVTYKADEYGYVADVKYEGEAKYDEYKPVNKSAYKSTDASYQADINYKKNNKPLDYIKDPINYSTTQDAEYTSKTTYATKSYDAPAAYTTPSYKPAEN